MRPEDLCKDEATANEHQHQVALFCWAALEAARDPARRGGLTQMFAIPNGGERNVVVASNLKAEGVRAGVPDICLPIPRFFLVNGLWSVYHGCWIELKDMRPRSVATEAQEKRIASLCSFSYFAMVCKGWRHAASVLEWYLDLGAS